VSFAEAMGDLSHEGIDATPVFAPGRVEINRLKKYLDVQDSAQYMGQQEQSNPRIRENS
jgi:hypothetical protein